MKKKSATLNLDSDNSEKDFCLINGCEDGARDGLDLVELKKKKIFPSLKCKTASKKKSTGNCKQKAKLNIDVYGSSVGIKTI